MKSGTFIVDTLEDAKGAMGRWLAAHEDVVVRREYAPIEMPPVPGAGRTVLIRIEFEEPDQGGTAFVSSPADVRKLFVEDTGKRSKVVRAASIKPP
jgi:hypothetical protein